MVITEPVDRASFTAELVSALDRAWAAIQARHPEVPDVVLTIGSGTLGLRPGQERLGHFAADRWQLGQDTARVPELFVGGEGLRRGAADVLATLLHEAAHGLAHTRGIKDTSRQGRYHNARYQALGIELGLVVEEVGIIGWSATRLPPSTAESYRRELAEIQRALIAYRHPETRDEGKPKSNNGTVARCECGRQFRITRTVLNLAPITCTACGTHFEDTNPEPDEQE